MAMGFDTFSSLLCLYGGSIAGLMGLISTERMNKHFGMSFGSEGKSFNYNGMAGMSFRLVTFALFVSIIILFNIWYCSRNRQKPIPGKRNNLIKEENPPPFNRTRKIILAVAGFFLFISILAQMPKFASVLKTDSLAKNTPPQISSEY